MIDVELYVPDEEPASSTCSTPAEVKQLVRDLQEWEWADLFLSTETTELAISANRDRYTVLAELPDDEFYVLVGTSTAEGTTKFAHGGQPADFPLRLIVDREAAETAASEFLVSEGRINPKDPEWELFG